MDPITPGSTGAAVEDIQERLVKLGYTIEDDERQSHTFGKSTARASNIEFTDLDDCGYSYLFTFQS